MAEQVRACAICGDNKATMHLLPKKEELRKKWLEFIFGTPPAKYNSNLVLCSNHFDYRDFSNFGAYSSGFASRLFIKPGSVPSRRSTTSSQTSTSQTLVTPPIHTSTQTDPPSLSCRATLLSMGTLGHPARSKVTQTESFMKSTSISTSTSDAPWGHATSMPLKHVHPRPAKRPRVVEEEEEDESDIFTIKPKPQDSYDPAQSMSNVTESLQPRDMSSTGYKDSKCIVFEKNLMELFETCPVCSRVSDVRTYKRGTYLSVVQKCNHCQYSKQWKSQPVMAAPL